MPNFLLVPIGTKTGLTSISLGLLRALQRSGRRPVYYKPVSHKPTPAGDTEAAIVFANKLFHLNPPRPQPLSKVEELVGAGRDDDLIELMVSDFDQVTAAEHDVAIIEGVVPDSERGFLANKNAQIAAALNANVILVAAAGNHSAEQVADQINLAAQEYANSHTDVAGFIINRYHGNDSKAFAAEVAAKVRSGIPCMGVLPFAPEQSLRRVADIAGYLNAQVIAGKEHLGNRTKEIVVAAQNAAHMHHRITSGALVITPGDREDILMAASLKILSGVPVAGLLLTCGTAPSPAVQGIISPALSQNVPVLLTEHDTFATAYALAHQDQTIPADDTERMETMVEFVAEHVDVEELCRHIGQPRQLLMSPPAFRFRMMEQARAANRRIVLPEGDEPRTVEAAAICQSKGIARCVLLAKPEAVREVAANRGITLPEGLEIIDPDTIRDRSSRELLARMRLLGYRVRFFDSTTGTRIPTVTAVAESLTTGSLCFGAGAHPDAERALASALSEVASDYVVARVRLERGRGHIESMLADFSRVRVMEDHADLFFHPDARPLASFLLDSQRDSLRDLGALSVPGAGAGVRGDLRLCLELLDPGLDVLVVEQTSPTQRALGMHGVKVLVPGLVPIDFGWHCQRALRMPRTRERAEHYRSRHRLATPCPAPAPVPHPFP